MQTRLVLLHQTYFFTFFLFFFYFSYIFFYFFLHFFLCLLFPLFFNFTVDADQVGSLIIPCMYTHQRAIGLLQQAVLFLRLKFELYQRAYGILKRVVWYFEEGRVVLWRGWYGTLKRVLWYFEKGRVVLWRGRLYYFKGWFYFYDWNLNFMVFYIIYSKVPNSNIPHSN